MSAQELISFLNSPRDDVIQVVLTNLLTFSLDAQNLDLFKANNWQGLLSVKALSLRDSAEEIVRDSLILLVNLTCNEEVRKIISADHDAVARHVTRALSETKLPYTRYLLMLLNNLARDSTIAKALNGQQLRGLFLVAASPMASHDPDYDFLFMAFAELAKHDSEGVARNIPLLFSQLIGGSLNRRLAIAASMKNCLFDEKLHDPMGNDTPLIETVMLALKGPATLDEEDTAKLPKVVRQSISADKKCEENTEVQLLLLQCLLLISSTHAGRDALRTKSAYFVVRELHSASDNPQVVEACETYVNMVMRGDPDLTASAANEAADDRVTEII